MKEIEKRYLTICCYNKFTKDILDAKEKQKSDIFGFINDSDLHKKIKKLASKAELKAEQDKIVKLETYNLSYFLGKFFF